MSTKTPEELAEAWHPSRPDDDNFDNGMRTGYAIALKEHVREEVSEPVAWLYTVNGAHVEVWTKEPPEDAYDAGSLIPLYTRPPAMKDGADDIMKVVQVWWREQVIPWIGSDKCTFDGDPRDLNRDLERRLASLYAHPPLAAKVEPRDQPREGEGDEREDLWDALGSDHGDEDNKPV